jgi:uncharacterized lipoprotein YajG
MRISALALSAALLLAGCAANQDTLNNLSYLQGACSNGSSVACMQIPATQNQADIEARGKTAALLLFPLVVLEAVALAKY